MGHRSKRAVRCIRCRMHLQRCICAEIPTLWTDTRICLVMHVREVNKTTATGPLALAALPNSELHLHGRKDEQLDLRVLHDSKKRVMVLYPGEGARALDEDCILEDERPVTLVVPDGNWRQAGRMPSRIPGLIEAERVTLPDGPPTRWGIRRETRSGGLATFEAIARAVGLLESRDIQQKLETAFETIVRVTIAQRGAVD